MQEKLVRFRWLLENVVWTNREKNEIMAILEDIERFFDRYNELLATYHGEPAGETAGVIPCADDQRHDVPSPQPERQHNCDPLEAV